MGPVQVLVVGYERPAFTGEVLAELARLSQEGLVRLVDVLLVTAPPTGASTPWTPPTPSGTRWSAIRPSTNGRVTRAGGM